MKLIDIGCFNGDSVLHFISDPNITSIEAYDPNGDFIDLWAAISKHYPSVKFHNKAVYTHNGTVKFTKRPKDYPLGSTIMKDKSGWGEGIIKDVECVDILDIVNSRCIIKIDAEGAEFDILERLIASGKTDFIEEIYVEWHDSKMSSDNKDRQINIVEHFGSRAKAWQ